VIYVLDTNTVSYFFRGEGGVADRLLATPPRDIALSVVTSYELRFGVARVSKAKRLATQLETLLAWITILPSDDSVAQVAANIRVELERAGQRIGPLDVLIAATSLAANGVLITRNVTEFRRIPGLNLQNWYE
jgi:tRNA(fMet)-specific endonuclease VapC